MVASFLLSSTLVPVLSVWLQRGHNGGATHADAFKRLAAGYASLLKPLVSARGLVLLVYVGLVAAAFYFIAPKVGTELFPKVDAGQIQLRLRASPGTPLEKTEAIALRVLELIQREAGADKVAMSIGLVGVHAQTYPINLIYQWNAGTQEGV